MSNSWDVGIDLDGCAYDFIDAIRREIRLFYPHLDPSPPADSWTFYERWGLDHDAFLNVYAQSVKQGRVLWEGDPYPGTVDAWQRLAEAGHRIHIITDRRPAGAEADAQRATISWLARHGLEYSSITFSHDKTLIRHIASHKERVVFVDDKAENFCALQSAGISAFLMDRPWNQHTEGPRVASLHDFAARVDQLTQRAIA